MEKTHAKQLFANLLHKLWRKIVVAVIYLYNQIPQMLNHWKSPYKLFYTYVFEKEKIFEPQKLFFYHLKAYSCKTYVLIKLKCNIKYPQKCWKLYAKAYIKYFVSYNLTNIYLMWILHK